MMWEEGGSSSGAAPAGGAAKAFLDMAKHDAVYNELMQECRHSAPGARLSAKLCTALERMSPRERRVLCDRKRDGCAPLFVACKRGNVEIVEYLVHVCDADIEQRGVYEVPDDRSVLTVTPLWCAAVSGRLEVLRALADAGADINAGSDSGSTPVRSACFMTHLDVVRFLVSRGADIHRPNHNGGTCLINSVQSVRLCAYLLEHGADVNARDTQLMTVLHYAIQEHRSVETVRLLLEHGANPALASRAGDDAMRTACLKGAAQVVSLLAGRGRYSAARMADAYELLGSTLLDEFNDVTAALASWRRATAIRHSGPRYVAKRPSRAPCPALGGAREWRSLAELEAAATDMDALRTQSLLVVARVLGPDHKDTVFRLMYRGASYADAFRYQRCIDLWSWALQIRIAKDSLLSTDTCHTACALTRLMLDAHAGRLERGRGLPLFADVLKIFRLLADDLPECQRLLEARPVFKSQADTFDRALRCVTHLVFLLQARAAGAGERAAAVAAVTQLVRADVRSAHTRDTMLHLCVSRLNVIDEMDVSPVFPHAGVVSLLLECGADVRVRNEARSTALHVAAIPDQPNKFGDSPAELVALNRGSRVRVLQHVSLACLFFFFFFFFFCRGETLMTSTHAEGTAWGYVGLSPTKNTPVPFLTFAGAAGSLAQSQRCSGRQAARAVLSSRAHVPRHALPRTLHDFLDLHRA